MARRFWSRSQVAATALLLAAACHRPVDGPPQIRLVSPADPDATAFVEVTGIPRAQQRALTSAPPAADGWPHVLRVSVRTDGQTANRIGVAGHYSVTDGALRFTPLFPFDPGRQYEVEFTPGAISGAPATSAPLTSQSEHTGWPWTRQADARTKPRRARTHYWFFVSWCLRLFVNAGDPWAVLIVLAG